MIRKESLVRLTVSVLAAAVVSAAMLLLSGCGGETQSVTVRDETRAGTRSDAQTRGGEPATTLIGDASQAIGARISESTGVHFTMEGATATGGLAVNTQGKGDMMFPNRMKMSTTNVVSGQPTEVEIVLFDGEVYTRSAATGGVWQKSSQGVAPPDPQSIKGYLDFARSSRNLGEETLRGGRKTWHLQLDIDSVRSAEDAKKRVNDPAVQAFIEQTKSYTITVDMWLGIDDLLPYQQKVKVDDPAGALRSETTFIYSNWGQAVEIVRPCQVC